MKAVTATLFCLSMITSALATASCVSGGAYQTGSTTSTPSGTAVAKLEAIENAGIRGGKLVFSAVSNGCSDSADFTFNADAIDNQCQAQIVRLKPDYCKKAPEIKRFEIDWSPPQACKGLPVVFDNPAMPSS